MAEEIKDDQKAIMAVQIMTEKSQQRLTKKLIELINAEFKILLCEDLRPVFKNVLLWFESEEEQIYNNIANVEVKNEH